jgi:hypothetical protein
VAKPHKYAGILAKPAPLDLRGLDPQSAAAEFRRWWQVRIAALFADCGVKPSDPNGWVSMTLLLAMRHVPGFADEPGKRRGAPRKTTLDDDDLDLFKEMNRRTSAGMSVKRAAEHVARQRRKNEKPTAIDIRYRRMLKSIGKGVALLRKEQARQK